MPPSRVAHTPLPRLSAVAPRLFYGWWVAFGGCLISLVCAGVGFYSQGVLLDALCAERGWSRASVSGASGLYFVVSGFAGLAVGRALDRVGPRAFIALGALLLAASLVAVGRVESQAMLYVWFPLMAVGASFAGPVPTASIVTHWFVSLRARAMTVSQTGVSLGGILLVPLATFLIHERGLPTAMAALAAIVVGVALPVVVFVLRSDPTRHGLLPDGHSAAARENAAAFAAAERSYRTRDALRTRGFWGIMLAFGIGLFAQVGFLAHQLAWLRERIGPRDAAFAVSATAFGSVVGRFVVGPIADRIEKRRIGVGLFWVQAAATLAFAHAPGSASAMAASFVFGLTMGNIFMMQPLLVGEFYGVVAFASVLGALQLGTQLASGLGPYAVGLAYDRLGGYPHAFEGLAGLAVLAGFVLSRVRAPRARSAEPH
jgi:sugar phosphate permease